MIRIVDMRGATSGEQAFSIWDTMIDRYVEVDGLQVFDGEEELKLMYERDDTDHRLPKLAKVLKLLPEWAKKKTEPKCYVEDWDIEVTDSMNWIGTKRRDGKINRIVCSVDREGLSDSSLNEKDADAKLIADAPRMLRAILNHESREALGEFKAIIKKHAQ